MASKEKQAPKNDEDGEEGQGGEAAGPKKGFVNKLLGNKLMLAIAAVVLLLVLGGGGAALYFFVLAPKPTAATAKASAPTIPLVPPQIAYYDMPDMTGNIQSADGTPVYLKLSLSLELPTTDEKAGLTVLQPRITDQIMGYLHELRVDDIKGSAGIMRLKEELLRRVNAAASPYRVRDVLIKEMYFQ